MTEPEILKESLCHYRPVLRPTAATWIRHILLLLVTFCTTTIAGTLFPFGKYMAFSEDDPQSLSELLQLIFTIPARYGAFIVEAINNLFATTDNLVYGLKFSVSLLFILTCHEMGHYIACRIYRVDATLPFFLPTP